MSELPAITLYSKYPETWQAKQWIQLSPPFHGNEWSHTTPPSLLPGEFTIIDYNGKAIRSTCLCTFVLLARSVNVPRLAVTAATSKSSGGIMLADTPRVLHTPRNADLPTPWFQPKHFRLGRDAPSFSCRLRSEGPQKEKKISVTWYRQRRNFAPSFPRLPWVAKARTPNAVENMSHLCELMPSRHKNKRLN
ncbi:hypothetical protein BKA82DRAFT_450416 [Pisolithus tinctorius]|uniref:Ig-like domain-containing protein n=1 Tax=Pisolithus tinctorius Marx 270 TaxID=870435 RepID=A0A0C3PXW8_PISTI|nr:hypothetical protein BKA82DRAFT_450416 [Pisolithus tinctorius]KIO13909.1 hypothetical protein M404DRAFT_450416 [Pisolithus tinctorius Marx 270]